MLRAHAYTLNFRDLVIATGTYPIPVKDDVVPFSDAAAIVEEVVPKVTSLSIEDFAIANFDIITQYGSYRDWYNGLAGLSMESAGHMLPCRPAAS